MIEYEHKYLRDVLIPLKKGAIKKTDIVLNGKYPILNSSRDYFGYFDKYNNDDKSIIITSHGAYAGFVSYIEGKYWAGSLCFPYKSKNENLYNPKYIFHYLKNNEQLNMEKIVLTGSIPYINKTELELLKIPFPPMEVQNEIVEVLDKFSALEAELEAELEARTKQYEYYKSKLIFSENKRLILSKLSRYSNTRISSEELTFSNYVGVDNLLQSKLGKVNSKYEPMIGSQTEYVAGDILIGNIRPYLRKIWYSDIRGGTNGDVLVIRVLPKMKNVIMDKFLYYVLSSEEFFYYMDATSKGAKMPRGDKNMIMQFEIPIPPLEEQERIVSILDKFSALVTDIKEGLPAEIELRHRQYEYYRNKLLTFDKE